MSSAPRHTLDQLLVLEAIARTGTFAAAARELHRVPSAVSYTVKTLEEALEVSLFDRSGHRASLTPAGRRILDGGAEILRRARALDTLARSLSDGWEPELRVVVDGLYSMAPITAALKAFGDQGIPTRVRLDVEFQEGVHERFHTDHADLMLILEMEVEGPLHATPLGELPMALVCSASHPLASAGTIGRDALLDHTELVVKDSASRYRSSPRSPFMGNQHVIYLSDFHAKLLGILGGAGYGWLPMHLANAHLETGDLQMVQLPDGNRWAYHPHLISRRDEPLGRAGKLFVELFLQEIQP